MAVRDLFYIMIQEQFKLLVSLVGEEIKKHDSKWRNFMVLLVIEQCRMFEKKSYISKSYDINFAKVK